VKQEDAHNIQIHNNNLTMLVCIYIYTQGVHVYALGEVVKKWVWHGLQTWTHFSHLLLKNLDFWILQGKTLNIVHSITVIEITLAVGTILLFYHPHGICEQYGVDRSARVIYLSCKQGLSVHLCCDTVVFIYRKKIHIWFMAIIFQDDMTVRVLVDVCYCAFIPRISLRLYTVLF